MFRVVVSNWSVVHVAEGTARCLACLFVLYGLGGVLTHHRQAFPMILRTLPISTTPIVPSLKII